MIPALDKSGKILMESKSRVKLVPNGNGSFFDVMDDNRELFAELAPFEYLQIIGVDNVLNKVLDPLFFGYAKKHSFDGAMKCCVKRDWSEKVGVLSSLNGKYGVAEYSDIPESIQ
jgi:UDP-N-acetylglucosamine/UDP-N-acetylgalactosamine diphosphorylase